MVTTSQIEHTLRQIVRRLVEGYQPEPIVMYGSMAYGEPDEDSDIDLPIVKETSATPLERRIRVRQLVSDPDRRIPFSSIVLTPDELARRLALGDPFYREIIDRGKVLYAQN